MNLKILGARIFLSAALLVSNISKADDPNTPPVPPTTPAPLQSVQILNVLSQVPGSARGIENLALKLLLNENNEIQGMYYHSQTNAVAPSSNCQLQSEDPNFTRRGCIISMEEIRNRTLMERFDGHDALSVQITDGFTAATGGQVVLRYPYVVNFENPAQDQTQTFTLNLTRSTEGAWQAQYLGATLTQFKVGFNFFAGGVRILVNNRPIAPEVH